MNNINSRYRAVHDSYWRQGTHTRALFHQSLQSQIRYGSELDQSYLFFVSDVKAVVLMSCGMQIHHHVLLRIRAQTLLIVHGK